MQTFSVSSLYLLSAPCHPWDHPLHWWRLAGYGVPFKTKFFTSLSSGQSMPTSPLVAVHERPVEVWPAKAHDLSPLNRTCFEFTSVSQVYLLTRATSIMGASFMFRKNAFILNKNLVIEGPLVAQVLILQSGNILWFFFLLEAWVNLFWDAQDGKPRIHVKNNQC